jgi:hypothetical protein
MTDGLLTSVWRWWRHSQGPPTHLRCLLQGCWTGGAILPRLLVSGTSGRRWIIGGFGFQNVILWLKNFFILVIKPVIWPQKNTSTVALAHCCLGNWRQRKQQLILILCILNDYTVLRSTWISKTVSRRQICVMGTTLNIFSGCLPCICSRLDSSICASRIRCSIVPLITISIQM